MSTKPPQTVQRRERPPQLHEPGRVHEPRANAHPVRAQLAQNAQFKAQMIARRGVGRPATAAVQRQAAPAPPAFQTKTMQTFVARYPLVPPTQKGRLQALQILDRPLSGPWSSALAWPKIQFQAAMRVMGHQTVHQDNYAVCGPAVVLQSMVESDPAGYARLVVEVFGSGRVAGKRVNSLLLQSKDYPGNDWFWVDWMTLWAMRDVENAVLVTHGSPDDVLSGGTSASDLTVMIRKHLKVKSVSSHANWILGDATQHHHRVNTALARGAYVYAMVDSSKMDGKASAPRPSFPTHWVRVDGPITIGRGGLVTMSTFNRGSHARYTFNGMDTIFEFVVAER